MYKYLHFIGCKISSFFNYIFESVKKQKKYKKDDDDEDDIIYYDNVYDNSSENAIYMSLIDA